MKGHVGGGLRDLVRFQGVLGVVSIRLFSQVLHVSIRNRFCAERLLEMSVFSWGIPPGDGMVHELESLIMAQNERWRHA